MQPLFCYPLIKGGKKVFKEKNDPIAVANHFIQQYYPHCQGAILAGSIVRGEGTSTSDLDIVIFDNSILSAFRESFYVEGWPVEVFIHNLSSYKHYFELDCERAKPSLPKMIVEGMVLKDDGLLSSIQGEARLLLSNGPKEWSKATITLKRYFLTDVLDDFIGSTTPEEDIFIVHTLLELASEFVLRVNRQWVGTSKWGYRALKQFDESFAHKFIEVFDAYYKHRDKVKIIELVDEILEPFGGRLFEGFSLGKSTSNDH
ncbi:nucleotidyltransferase domain-containing protein [Psychrobacillus sp. AK 1817]|uniref:Nucleotidyltransferase domain-containing protein n=1 Tax=Psychrobacillus faecigallinarum TaxID=2762235 RepID=A0ABR8REK8_9BACI|nr:nucleotidyltransferase domain-containing protein [Psychrobacillus faecigallinarum]QEY21328.1 nucleotidyltransferase domain-containing protein [Psychrobacillus sp. AK 1817]